MKNELRNLIRELSEMYDINSRDTYISVYLNKNNDKTFLEKRVNELHQRMRDSKLHSARKCKY